jgi:hypothetical protein
MNEKRRAPNARRFYLAGRLRRQRIAIAVRQMIPDCEGQQH